MAKKISAFIQYLRSSRTIHYGLILTLPLLAIYEIGILFLFKNAFFEMRNSGEILLRSFFDWLGLSNPNIISGILLCVFIIVMVRGYQIEKKPGIKADYFIYMLLESMFWGAVLFICLQLFTQIPLQIVTLEDKLANMNLAVGAGIYEELIFRMVLIGALLVLFREGFAIPQKWSIPMSIFISALIFAAFHLFMEVYSFPIYSQRVLGGIFLGTLYWYRGYGITVYAHIIFNILILAASW